MDVVIISYIQGFTPFLKKYLQMLASQSANKSVILIVEDEALLRMTASWLLQEAGFDALEAGNADEAIALLESHNDDSFGLHRY